MLQKYRDKNNNKTKNKQNSTPYCLVVGQLRNGSVRTGPNPKKCDRVFKQSLKNIEDNDVQWMGKFFRTWNLTFTCNCVTEIKLIKNSKTIMTINITDA